MRTPFLAITASNQVQFAFRFLPVGARYGQTNALTVDDKPQVEVYDTRHADDKLDYSPLGELVTRYDVNNLLAGHGDLHLHAGIPAWTVDAQSMTVVRAWLRMMVGLGEVVTS